MDMHENFDNNSDKQNCNDSIIAQDTVELNNDIEVFDKEDMVSIFSKLFNENFEKADNESYWFAQLNVADGETEQTYLVTLDGLDKNTEYPVKIFPVSPSAKEILGYEDKPDELYCTIFSIANDEKNAGEVILITPHMKRVFKSYKENGRFSEQEIAELLQEIADWTVRTSFLRKAAIDKKKAQSKPKRKPFAYTSRECNKCKRVVMSERAYIAMLAEALSRDPLETGGVLLGHYDTNGTWYVVEATDPGLDTYHSAVHNEMDDKYYNHLYPVLSRLYKRDLALLGLWHRHPGSYDRFSNDDNNTNRAFAEAIGNGTLSFLMNFDPNERLTCYYLDETGTGEYHTLPVFIGDKYFKRTDYLELNTPRNLWKDQKRLNEEIWAERNGG